MKEYQEELVEIQLNWDDHDHWLNVHGETE